MRVMLSALILGGAILNGAAHAQEVTLEAAPPVVVKTVPEAGVSDVDPVTTEIRVTFSKEMQDGSWSWATHSRESFPETTGKPKYLEDQRTCVLPVKLAPGKTYALWINSQKFRNFKDAKGQPAVPYLLVFTTKRAG
jgi:Bacterial Ig-like domain